MSKYIKVFDTVEEYNAYSGGTAFTSPNISYIKSTDETKYDDNEIKHYSEDCESWIKIIPQESYTSTTFSINNAVESVEIPSGCTSISDSGLYGFKSLKRLVIPDSVTNVGYQAVAFCTALESVTIGSGLTVISTSMFSHCTVLSGVTIPTTITKLYDSCFTDCHSLTEIEIPSGVTLIDYYAFFNCDGLTNVILNCSTPPNLGSAAFYNTTCIFYVPDESVDAYKSATNWSSLSDRIKPISEKPNN